MKSGDVVASRYRLEQKLGMGGMGTVWSAEHTQTGRLFALKIMHSTVAANEESRQRFLKEAKASARIDHPNVIDVLDVGELPEGVLFMAMELLEGLPLVDALRLDPPLSVRELLVVLRETSAALAAAHLVGIVHRDVKPANVFLHRDRGSGMIRPKILDFGVSKFAFLEESATHTGSLLGSPRYMSPEQARSAAQADARSDVWSLGVILFEALTGTYPHEGESFSNLVVAIATTPPRAVADVAPMVPRALGALVDECLLPRDQRLASCELFAARIDDLLTTHDLAHTPCARGKNKKPLARPADFFVRSTAEMGWSTEHGRRGSSSSIAAVRAAPAAADAPFGGAASTFDFPSQTTNPLPSERTSELSAPSSRTTTAVTSPTLKRPPPDRSKTTPMAPTAQELAGLMARLGQAAPPPRRPADAPGPELPRLHEGGEETRIHARPPPSMSGGHPPPSQHNEGATRLITRPDADEGTSTYTHSVSMSGSLPSVSLSSVSLPSGSLASGSLASGSLASGSLASGSLASGSLPGGYAPPDLQVTQPFQARPSAMAAPAPALAYPGDGRDHLVESVSTFGVERHRPISNLPGPAPSGDVSPFRRRHAGAAIGAASVVVLGLVVGIVVVMGGGRDATRASSPALAAPPTEAGRLVVTASPDELAPEPPPAASVDAPPTDPPGDVSPTSAASAPSASASASARPSASASTAPATSASAPKLGGPWPGGAPPTAVPGWGRPPGGCARDAMNCPGSGP